MDGKYHFAKIVVPRVAAGKWKATGYPWVLGGLQTALVSSWHLKSGDV